MPFTGHGRNEQKAALFAVALPPCCEIHSVCTYLHVCMNCVSCILFLAFFVQHCMIMDLPELTPGEASIINSSHEGDTSRGWFVAFSVM